MPVSPWMQAMRPSEVVSGATSWAEAGCIASRMKRNTNKGIVRTYQTVYGLTV
jgi:hypothetical protein